MLLCSVLASDTVSLSYLIEICNVKRVCWGGSVPNSKVTSGPRPHVTQGRAIYVCDRQERRSVPSNYPFTLQPLPPPPSAPAVESSTHSIPSPRRECKERGVVWRYVLCPLSGVDQGFSVLSTTASCWGRGVHGRVTET